MLLSFGLLSLLVGWPVFAYLSTVHETQLMEDRQSVLNALALTTSAALTQSLEDHSREVALLAQLPVWNRGPLNAPDATMLVNRLKRSGKSYHWVGVADRNGVVQAASGGFLVGQSVANRPWFAAGTEGDHVGNFSDAILLEDLLQPDVGAERLRFIEFASPIQSEEGRALGVLAAQVHWHWASEVIRAITPPTAAAQILDILIVDASSGVIYPEARRTLMPPDHRAVMAQPLSFHPWGDGHRYLTSVARVRAPASGVDLDWLVYVRSAETVVKAELAVLQRAALMAILAAGAAFWLLAWALAHRVSHPLRRLTQMAQRLGRGERTLSFASVDSPREVRDLSAALQTMSATLLDAQHALEQANHDLENKVAERTHELQSLAERLAGQARTDALTALPNRLAATERLGFEFERLQRSGDSYCVAMLDIDFFKKVNDQYGHAVGDDVLQSVARVLADTIRTTDFGARMGGEEFLVLLPMTDLAGAAAVAEKIRAAVEHTEIAPVGRVTVSIGVEIARADDADADAALVRADERLYAAKAEGRNRVVAGG